jgi:enoyl-CoA hydratase/carnithine racemase
MTAVQTTATNLAVMHDGPVATITLNRPQRRNALSLELMQELIVCLDRLSRSSETRAIILAAAGKVFCSGHDLSEMTGRTLADYRRIFDVCSDLMTKLQSIPQPVVAQVHGIATAAGCQLVAACDLVVASEDAAFATPGVKIGIFCSTPMVALTRAIGRKRALQMLLTGELVDARTAAEWGLVNEVVPPAELAAATQRLALKVAEASPLTVAIGKQAFYAQIDLDQPKAYAYTKEVMSMNAMASDAQEGITAFLQKRQPLLDRQLAMWRTHSCVPRRQSCRRLPGIQRALRFKRVCQSVGSAGFL